MRRPRNAPGTPAPVACLAYPFANTEERGTVVYGSRGS